MRRHAFPWCWSLKDLDAVPKHRSTVFSCFACGGGSTMGYKLAVYDVLGDCEIDPRMNALYVANNHPKHNYLMDIRDFLKQDLPEELYRLDVLDGSPPCSTFSMAGRREAGWGVEKQFREGQKMQRLDDLFFWFIAVADKLKPKIVVAENVVGILRGNAKGYVNEVIKAFDNAGYEVQIFRLNAAQMGVPQKRERVFFIGRRKDLELPKLELRFDEDPIPFGTVRSAAGKPVNPATVIGRALSHRRIGDRDLADINKRLREKNSGFTSPIVSDENVANILASGGGYYRMADGMAYSDEDCRNVQSFPQDYDFGRASVQYVCGMSVPPVMMANIAKKIYEQWLR